MLGEALLGFDWAHVEELDGRGRHYGDWYLVGKVVDDRCMFGRTYGRLWAEVSRDGLLICFDWRTRMLQDQEAERTYKSHLVHALGGLHQTDSGDPASEGHYSAKIDLQHQ